MDQRVEIYGATRHDMNGKRGIATDYHYYQDDPHNNRDRYTVLLDNGEQFKVPPSKLRAERAEATGGARPKAKGKGKKGRGKKGR